MATSQLTLFDLETLPGMACRKPSKQYPSGRTGTSAGYHVHRKAGEHACGPCRKAHTAKGKHWEESNPEYRISYRKDNREKSTKYFREYYIGNQDRIKTRTSEYYHENKEKLAPARKRYADKNRDKNKAYSAWYRQENIEYLTEYDKQYRENNPDKVQVWGMEGQRRRRARKISLPVEMYTLDDVTNKHGTVCYLCNTQVDTTLLSGRPDSPHIDHVHPISREGCPGDVLENCRVVHARCNLVKGAKMVSELTLPFPPPQATTTELPGSPDLAQ